MAKWLKLKVRSFWGPNLTFVEVTGEKLAGVAFCPPTPILNRVKLIFFQVWIKGSHQNRNFECLEKICHIPHVIFQTTSQLKVMLDKSVINVLGEGM